MLHCRSTPTLCCLEHCFSSMPPTLVLAAGVPLAGGMYRALSAPIEAWHFDMRCPPEDSGRKTLDFEFTADGVCNAVVFWYTLQLSEGISLSSAPGEGHPASGPLPLLGCPAVYFCDSLVGWSFLPPLACHNLVR